MSNSSLDKQGEIIQEPKKFSLKSGFKIFLKANLLVVFILLLFILNYGVWRGTGGSAISMFIFTLEVFLILIGVLACVKPTTKKRKFSMPQKNEWLGLGIATILFSLMSLIFTGIHIPYPSTLVLLTIFTNAMVALYSIIFHKPAIALYESNVYGEAESVMDYTFKFIAVLFSGINYHIQIILIRLPLIVNKLIAIVFIFFLLWQSAVLINVFEQ
ncbi:hypothetical protein [Halobacillus naozhouensis]|uniref:Uncharacterized protein n=1 Tax=Halobacillus naozhouensis TaxID=554880 RepID=A0ABY8IX69_9BACI|nr:hypothetical protein [Halobacillus naozhouensis]WFT74805.1 hypothetical protein P9989_21125 [Halobacillus naozhouensis]